MHCSSLLAQAGAQAGGCGQGCLALQRLGHHCCSWVQQGRVQQLLNGGCCCLGQGGGGSTASASASTWQGAQQQHGSQGASSLLWPGRGVGEQAAAQGGAGSSQHSCAGALQQGGRGASPAQSLCCDQRAGSPPGPAPVQEGSNALARGWQPGCSLLLGLLGCSSSCAGRAAPHPQGLCHLLCQRGAGCQLRRRPSWASTAPAGRCKDAQAGAPSVANAGLQALHATEHLRGRVCSAQQVAIALAHQALQGLATLLCLCSALQHHAADLIDGKARKQVLGGVELHGLLGQMGSSVQGAASGSTGPLISAPLNSKHKVTHKEKLMLPGPQGCRNKPSDRRP